MDEVALPEAAASTRVRVRDFLASVVAPVEAAAGEQAWGRDEWRRALTELGADARERGLWAPHLPPRWGGSGLDAVSAAVVLAEAAASRLGSAVMNVRAPDVATGDALLHFGTDEQRDRFLGPLGAGRKRSAREADRPGPLVPTLRAEPSGGGWTLHGGPLALAGAERAGLVLVAAATSAGPTALCLELPAEGWTTGPPVPSLGVDARAVGATGVAVPADAVVGRAGHGGEVMARGLELVVLARCLRWHALGCAVAERIGAHIAEAPPAVAAAFAVEAGRSLVDMTHAGLVVSDLVAAVADWSVGADRLSMARIGVGEAFAAAVDRCTRIEADLGSTDPLPAAVRRQARWAAVAGGTPEAHLAALSGVYLNQMRW